MFNLGKDVFLVHELRELVGRKEFLDTSLKRTLVDDLDWKSLSSVDCRHAVLHVALDLRHTDADVLLKEFANVTYAALCKVVDVVSLCSRSV